MSILIKGVNIKEIKRGAVAAVNIDDVVYFVHGDDIVPVPDHGDLIDRDVLKDECKEPYVWWETATQMAVILSDSPVVIPAERSEDGET